MGFMAGFGPAFSRSFEMGNERAAKRKDDLFKLTYSDLIDRRNEVTKYKKEDSDAARKAEAILERTGVDPRAYPYVFKQVRAGADESSLINELRTGQFEFGDEETKTAGDTAPEAPGADPEMADTDGQMEQSGMAPEAPQEAPAPEGMGAPAPQAPQMSAPAPAAPAPANGGLLSKIFPGMKMGGSGVERAEAQAAEAAGMTPEEAAEVRAGYTPPEIDTSGITFTPGGKDDFVPMAESIFKREQARKAGNVAQYEHFNDMVKSHDLANDMAELSKQSGGAMWLVRDAEGNERHVMGRQTENGVLDPKTDEVLEPVRIISDRELDLWDELAKDSDTIVKYKKKQADLAGLYTLGDELGKMASLAPDSLTVVGGVSTGLAAITREADALINTIGNLGASPEQMSQLQEYESKITDALMSPGMKNAAEIRTLMESKLKLASYRFSASEGEEGRSRSNVDIQRFDEILRASRDPEVFKRNIAAYLADIEKQVDVEGNQLNQYNPTIEAIKQYGYTPVETIVPTFSDFWASTSDGKAYESMKKYHEDNALPDAVQAPAPAPAGAPAAPTAARQPSQASITALKNNTALAAEFDKTYGPGAAQRILEGQ